MRRAAQLKRHFPHLSIRDVRGNLNTRLRKLDEEDGSYAALILAVAGVKRMQWESRISQYLDTDLSLYAVGQGALALECRESDKAVRQLLATFSHQDTLIRCIAERAFLKTLEGGCSAPVAVDSRFEGGLLSMTGGVWSLEGDVSIIESAQHNLNELLAAEPQHSTASFAAIVASHIDSSLLVGAEKLGVQLAERIVSLGGDLVLKVAKEETERRKLVAANVRPH